MLQALFGVQRVGTGSAQQEQSQNRLEDEWVGGSPCIHKHDAYNSVPFI